MKSYGIKFLFVVAIAVLFLAGTSYLFLPQQAKTEVATTAAQKPEVYKAPPPYTGLTRPDKTEGYQYPPPLGVSVDQGGEDCASATVIGSLPYNNSGTTAGYADDYDCDDAPGCYATSTAPDVVYSYSPGSDIAVDIDLWGSSYDTKVYVFENDCGTSPDCYACNDDYYGSPTWQSKIVNVPLYAGNTYYIVVDGYSSNSGAYVISVTEYQECDVVCPPGGVDEGEVDCYPDYDDIYNVGCNGPPYVFSPIACGDTICGTSGVFPFGASTYRDMDWFRIELTAGATLTWSGVGEFPVALWIMDAGSDDCSDYFNIVFDYGEPCDTISISAEVLAGVYYFIIAPVNWEDWPCGVEYVAWLDCEFATTGACCEDADPYTCQELTEAECDAMGAGYTFLGLGTDCDPNPCIPQMEGGETCDDAYVIGSLPFTGTGNTCDNQDDYEAVCPYGPYTAPEVVYSYTPAQDELVTIDLCNSSYDTKVYVYEDVCETDPYVFYACNDDDCGLQSRILCLDLYYGHTYYIVVGGYNASSCGDYIMDLSVCQPCEVVCPPGGYDEGEGYCYDDYDDTYNVGCNGVPPNFIFQTLACGDTICGSCGVYDFFGSTYRDMDWFEVQCSAGPLTLTCVAEFPLALWLFDPGSFDCVDLVNLDFINTTELCDTLSVSANVTSGTYWMIIAPADWGDYPCGPTSEYVAWVDCQFLGPEIAVDPAAFDLLLNPDGDCSTADEDLDISNTGGENLTYSIVENPEVDWMELAVYSGTVIPGATDHIAVSFDAGGMAPGDYNCDLEITHNDPGVPSPLVVPVDLKVELAPEFEAPPRVWMPVIPGCEMDEVFTVENLGLGDLRFGVSVQGSPPPLGAPQGRNQERMFNLVPNRKAEDIFKSGASPSATGNLSTVAPSDASKVNIQRSPGVPKSLPDDIIWDNGWDAGYAASSQLDLGYPFVSQVADDFILDGSMNITDVHWWGGFWNGPPDEVDPLDFYIYIYADDGTGNAPTGAGMADPSPTALATYFFSQLTGYPLSPYGNHEYDVVLDPPFPAEGGVKYWIAIQAVFNFPPQWGWITSSMIQLHTAVQGFPLLGTPFWTSTAYDVAFYLTGAAGCPFTVAPEADTVEGGGYSNLILTFDGTLFTDCVDETLTCYLVFTTNDCDEPVVSVPVHAWSARGDVSIECAPCNIDIADVIFLLNHIFGIGPAPDPMCMGDLDRDGDVDSDDVLYLIEYLFLGGPPPEIPTVPVKQTIPIQQK